MTGSGCFKETHRPLQVDSWNNDGTTQMYDSKSSFETKIRLKYKYMSVTQYRHSEWLPVLF